MQTDLGLTVFLGEGFLKMWITRYSLAMTAPNAKANPNVSVHICNYMKINK